MRRLIPAALLSLTGAALLRISVGSDLYLRYVKEGLRPALIASGAVLLALGLLAAARDLRGHGHTESGHHNHIPKTALLLALPAVMLLLFAPPALGSFTVARDGSGGIEKRATFDPLPAGGPIAMTLTDFTTRAVWDPNESLKGRTVRLTGFATPGPAGTWQLARIIVTCCAADARSVKVEIHGLPAPAANTWVTVTGTWLPAAHDPTLDADALTRIPEPAHPYRDSVQP